MFFLAYAGLRWSPDDVFQMPSERRRWFVTRLEAQKEYEQAELEKDKK